MGSELFVRLTPERKAEILDENTRHWQRIQELQAKKQLANDGFNREIKVEQEAMDRNYRVCQDDGENRDQMTLTFEEQKAATEALAALYRRVECTSIESRECPIHGSCSCDPTEDGLMPALEDHRSPGCALHGFDAAHAKDVPPPEPVAEQIPSEDALIAGLAAEFVASLNRANPTRAEMNHLLTGWFAAREAAGDPVARKWRGRVRNAATKLLGDPLPPAGAGATDAPAQDEVSQETAEAGA